MGKDLRDIIEAAEGAISTYRRPNVDEARERITELLNAAGMGGIGQFDRIESISEEDGTLHISTSYVVRGCESSDSFELPSAVIDADDPVKAAREWGLGRRISLAEAEVTEARAVLDQREKKLAELRSAAGVDVPLAPSTYAPSREVVQQALELVDRIRDSHASWGGWSGIPQTCERITNMLRYGSADGVDGTLNEQENDRGG